MNAATGLRDTLFSTDPEQLGWLPWAMEGVYFKLLHADLGTGRFSLLIKMMPGVVAPPHRHVGAVEGMILEGGFHYLDAPEIRFTKGMYLHEDDGALHEPASPEGALMFGVFHGALEGFNRAGEVAIVMDCHWHVDAWAAGSASNHSVYG